MSGFSRYASAIVYSLLNFFPYLILALSPFTTKLRFNKRVTIALVTLLSVLQVVIGLCAIVFFPNRVKLLSFSSTLIYGAFFIFSVKERLGKLVFVLLLVSNYANFIVMLSKALENTLFPELAVQSYQWSFILMSALVLALTLPAMFLFFIKILRPSLLLKTADNAWAFLWFVPATFYMCWYMLLYFNYNGSGETATRWSNAFVTAVMNVGALFIYYIVAHALTQADNNMRLQSENFALGLENMQYKNLTERIEETRIARHDLRQHLSVLNSLISQKEYKRAEEYIGNILKTVTSERPLLQCANITLSAVVSYYADFAAKNDISFLTEISVPKELPIKDSDITVLFGNLLENACTACLSVPEANRNIVFKVSMPSSKMLTFILDNSFSGEVREEDGKFVSSKHSGLGLGTQSAKNVVGRYGGELKFETKNDTFCVSGILNL